MKLTSTTAISIALLSSSAIASTGIPGTPPSGAGTASGWTQTDENGGFTETMTIQGSTKIVVLPWMWKLGDGSPKTADGKDLFKLGTYQFKKGTDTALINQGNAGTTGKYRYTEITPSEPIDLISGYTQKPFAQGRAGITPEITIQDANSQEIKLIYGSSLQSIDIKATGTPEQGSGSIDGVLKIKVGSALGVTYKGYWGGNYNTWYDLSGCSGYSQYSSKVSALVAESTDPLAVQSSLSCNTSVNTSNILNGSDKGSSGRYYNYKNLTGVAYAGIDNLTMIWTGDELPASWTAPVKITVTMI
ncbi:hypothetical protein [Photobacterium damselae]|uniref:hypothetical protein n=1 Tax=Photobacterium damselae TaxID=38293 RepID=UPI001F3B0765|nr:hypothetical protein [Photobacterium damselae]UKA03985.1 hypothetical protein IHC89_15770 [Photobacterium damselae subsp. damselae]